MPERAESGASRARFGRGPGILIAFVLGVLLGATAVVEVVPADVVIADGGLGQQQGTDGSGQFVESPTATSGSGTGGGSASTASATGGSTSATATSGSATSGSSTSGQVSTSSATGSSATGSAGGASGSTGQEIACAAGRNGGATDRGVTENEIRMGTTVVESGIGSAFLGQVRFGMDAVVTSVNSKGGICGRFLSVTYRDDGWQADRGAGFLRNFLEEGVFAIPVGPSSEGLNAVIESGDFDTAQVPVVGTDGLIIKQYQKDDGSAQPWVWPIAVATVSSARIMAQDAYDRGAKDFSIVFDSNYRFGFEAAEAFNAQVRELTGSDIVGYSEGATTCSQSYCGVTAGEYSYSSQVQGFREGDFVALFLEPDTALKWMNDSNSPSARDASIPYGYSAAQPLFTRDFAEKCKTKCDGMRVWTGFKPFEEEYRSDPSVQQYVNDLRAINPSADVNNQFTQGAYIGMQLLIEGLKSVGPTLTRLNLKNALDKMKLSTGLTLKDPLIYSPSNRYVATQMQAWEIQYKGTFAGWTAGQTVSDPRFG